MLETNTNYMQVGIFCDDCNNCYPVYKNVANGTLVYENDDTCDLYEFLEVNGSDEMKEATTESLISVVNKLYKTGLRGIIPLEGGNMLGIYLVAEDTYAYGIQHICKYYAGETPVLEPIKIEDFN